MQSVRRISDEALARSPRRLATPGGVSRPVLLDNAVAWRWRSVAG